MKAEGLKLSAALHFVLIDPGASWSCMLDLFFILRTSTVRVTNVKISKLSKLCHLSSNSKVVKVVHVAKLQFVWLE